MESDVTPQQTRATGEPVALTGAAQALIASVIALIVAFGIPVSQDQKVAILGVGGGLYSIIAPLVAAWYARKRVTPV